MPTSEVRLAARRVAERLGLDEGWLNDGAKAFIPGADPHQREVFEGDYLQVAAASPRFLLAMKLLAARVERDQDDIRALYRLCGFTTAEEGLRLVQSTYPDYLLLRERGSCLRKCSPPERPIATKNSKGGASEFETRQRLLSLSPQPIAAQTYLLPTFSSMEV